MRGACSTQRSNATCVSTRNVEASSVVTEAERGLLYIDVHYALRGTNDPRNLVFPFYTIPEHAPTSPGG